MKEEEIIQEFKERIIFTIEKIFDEDNEVRPILFGVKRVEDNVGVIICDGLVSLFANPLGKVLARTIMEQFVEKVEPIAVAFVSEGWSVEANQEKIDCAPSEHPDRKEILYITFETKNDSYYYGWEIQRKDNEKPTLVHKFDSGWERKKTRHGLFDHLLGTPEPTDTEKIAMDLLNNTNNE